MQKIENGDLPEMQNRLDNSSQSDDPFMYSAAYFGMTGRYGLWVYDHSDQYIVVARHPNDQDKVIIFLPHEELNTFIINDAINELNFPVGEIEIARVRPSKSCRTIELLSTHYEVQINREKKLDWTYPVHIYSASKVVKRKGQKFRQLRNSYNHATIKGVIAEPVDGYRHRQDIEMVVHQWAQQDRWAQRNESGLTYTYDDLTTPTKSLLNLMGDNNPLSIQGIVVYSKKKTPIGFWLWHEMNGVALSLARASIGHLENEEIRGAAEFAGVIMAEMLEKKGIDKVCFGGSEASGLDDFKRKFRPTQSIDFRTLTIRSV